MSRVDTAFVREISIDPIRMTATGLNDDCMTGAEAMRTDSASGTSTNSCLGQEEVLHRRPAYLRLS